MPNLKTALKSPILWVGVAVGFFLIPQIRKVIGK